MDKRRAIQIMTKAICREASDYHIYAGQSMRDLREVLARAKDFVTTIVKPEPTYLGDFIDIHGNGNITND